MASPAITEPTPSKLPRWRGFNLLEKFSKDWSNADFHEDDFRWIADWGFDFVRLPMDYRCWIRDGDWRRIDDDALAPVDRAVAWGERYGVHVNLNLHRAPGYCVNPPKEAKDLWTDPEARDVAALHWAHLARRYRGRPNTKVSFDLFNEPANVDNATYAEVVRLMVAAIHKEDPDRLIVADGNRWGNEPVFELADAGVAQSTRGYAPMWISHHKATWVNWEESWPAPEWPKAGPDPFTKERLWKEQIEPWQALEAKGVGIHVGEWGPFHQCPHRVALAWAEDCLANWKRAGWGWALWNFRGSFGILDAKRNGAPTEDWHGHALDRAFLDLLRRS
jgi:endoglucanase